jgi:hypothetical protein
MHASSSRTYTTKSNQRADCAQHPGRFPAKQKTGDTSTMIFIPKQFRYELIYTSLLLLLHNCSQSLHAMTSR